MGEASLSIERDENIVFDDLGALIASTRWISTHDEGIAEWMKNARLAYQIDRANVIDADRVCVLVFWMLVALLSKTSSDGANGTIPVPRRGAHICRMRRRRATVARLTRPVGSAGLQYRAEAASRRASYSRG